MSAYAIVRAEVHDPERYETYRVLATKAIEIHGGTFLARGGQSICKEGEMRSRNVLVRFDSVAAAEAFYDSPEYQAALEHGLPASTRDYIIVEGVD